MAKEIWKTIPGFVNYEISNLGRIKSIARTVIRGTQSCFLKECIRVLKTEKTGYITIGLSYAPKKYKHLKIHRLMAQAFIPNPEKKLFVNHKNGIKSDNRIRNLEWVTCSENANHALKNKLFIPKFGSGHYASKLSEKDVKRIRKMGERLTQKKIADIYSVSRENIRQILNGKTWKHV